MVLGACHRVGGQEACHHAGGQGAYHLAAVQGAFHHVEVEEACHRVVGRVAVSEGDQSEETQVEVVEVDH